MSTPTPTLLTFVFVLAFGLGPARAAAEVEMPPRNPKGKVAQQVGLTEIAVDYSSPAVRGRAIWGAVVPYQESWRTGDHPAAQVTFSREVAFGGQKVPAGTYALVAIPGPAEWTLVLHKSEATGQELARVKVRARPAPHRERLTFVFSDFTNDAATLDLEWERVRVSIPIGVDTRGQVMAEIGALDEVWRAYASAARYMLETKKDYDAGLRYAEKSLALRQDWQTVWLKASLLAAKGRYGDARAQGEEASALGQKAGDAAFSPAEIGKTIARWSRAAGKPSRPAPARALAMEDDPPAPRSEEGPAAEALTPPPLAAVVERPVATSTLSPAAARALRGSSTPKPSDIAPVVQKGRADIQTCYQRALRQDPTLRSGKLSISISVGVSGMVRGVVLDAPRELRALEPCIKEVVSRWVFPLSSAEYGAELPIVLQGKE